MSEFIFYAIKTILGLGIFALIYRFTYTKEVNFISRRAFLLFSVLLSFILPLFSFNISFIGPTGTGEFNSLLLNEITIYSNGLKSIETNSIIPLRKILFLVYFLVVIVLTLRLLYQLIRILLAIRKYSSRRFKDLQIYRIPLKNTSFSFFRHVFIGETPEENDLEKILAHEKVHALQWHTFDVLLMEFLCIIFWFNPLIWWFKTEVKNVHEYLADDGALREGYNAKSYQITLLEHLIGSASIPITNNFNYSLIKNRITMMNIEKKGRKNLWKILLLLPISLALVLVFACTEKSEQSDMSNLNQDSGLYFETAYSAVDVMPEFPGGFPELRKFIVKNLTYPKGAIDNNVAGRVMVQFVVNKEGKVVTKLEQFRLENESKIIDGVVVVGFEAAEGSPSENADQYIQELKDEAVRVLSQLPDFEKPGMKNGKPVAVAFTMPITFALQ